MYCSNLFMVDSQVTGVKLCAESKLSEPKVIDVVEIIPNKGALGKAFKTDAKQISEALAALSIQEVFEWQPFHLTQGCTTQISWRAKKNFLENLRAKTD